MLMMLFCFMGMLYDVGMIPLQHSQLPVELKHHLYIQRSDNSVHKWTYLECYDSRGTEAKISRVAELVFIAPCFLFRRVWYRPSAPSFPTLALFPVFRHTANKLVVLACIIRGNFVQALTFLLQLYPVSIPCKRFWQGISSRYSGPHPKFPWRLTEMDVKTGI
jgi:hypothetical protein